MLEHLIMQLNPYFENRRTPKFQLRSKHITEVELLYLYLCKHMPLPFQYTSVLLTAEMPSLNVPCASAEALPGYLRY